MTRAWAAALLVSPRQDDYRSLNEILEGSGWMLLYASEWRLARHALHRHRFDVVLTARRFPDGHSWQDVLREALQTQGAPPVVVLSDAADGSLWAEVLRLGAFDVLLQPLNSEEVVACLNLVQPLVTTHRDPAAGAGTETILVAEAPEVQCFIRNVPERRRYRVLTPAAAEVIGFETCPVGVASHASLRL